MAFPTALKVLGPALTSVAEGVQAVPTLVDKDEELQAKHDLRPLTLEEAKLRVQKTRESLHPPHFTSYGIYEYDPAIGKYGYRQTEEQKRHSAKEAEMGALALYGTYPEGSPQKTLYDATIGKMQAPKVAADAKAALVPGRLQQWENQAKHWQGLEEVARKRNSITAGHYGQQAAYWNGLLALRKQALEKDPTSIQELDRIGEMLQSNDPQQVDLAQQWLERKNIGVTREQRLQDREPLVKDNLQGRTDLGKSRLLHGINKEERDEETHQLRQRTGEQKLADVQTKSKYLDERQKAELARILEQTAALKARGEAMGPYLEARLQKLTESAEQARNREARAAEKAPADLAVRQEQLDKLKAQRVSPARQLTIRKLEAEIAELKSRTAERGSGGEVDVQTIGPQGEQTTARYKGKDADLYRFLQGRMTGDATKDAAMVLAIPRAHERLIARDAYQQRYGKRLPAEAEGGMPATESTSVPGTAPGQLSVAETLEQIQKIGLPDPDGPGDRAVQEFLKRFKAMTPDKALEGYKTLKDPEMKKAFRIAYLDIYKRKPPE